jgi:parallel beta-helix repeat protein
MGEPLISRASPIIAILFALSLSYALFVDAAIAATVSLPMGMNLIGVPSATASTFTECDIAYLNSSSNRSCQYSTKGPLVFFDTNPSAGGATDCGSNYRSASVMQQGLGYFVRASKACDISFTVPSTVDVTLVRGLNIVSVPVRTIIDDVARICGDKTKIIGYFNSSSDTSCRYDRNGYFIRYDPSINGMGDCGSNYVSDDALEPFVGYFVRFMGRNGDGQSPCMLRYQEGRIVEIPISSSTTTSSKSTTTTSARSSTTTSLAKSSTTTISGGVVIVDSTIVLTSSFDGGGKTYRHGPNLGDYPMFRLSGTGVTLSNVILDDNNFLGTYAAAVVSGIGNTLQDSSLINCQRYGIVFQTATRGTIRRVTVQKAQHGISGSSGSVGEWNPSTDCVIENNTISGMIIDGIKLKNMLRTIVRNNVIDVYPFNPGYIGGTATYSKSGIYFAATDTANKDCIVANNTIFQSAPHALKNRGILVNPDQTVHTNVVSTGNRILNNSMRDMEYGILIKGNYYYVAGNHFDDVATTIANTGTNNTVVA